jgi:hypothetical protein
MTLAGTTLHIQTVIYTATGVYNQAPLRSAFLKIVYIDRVDKQCI